MFNPNQSGQVNPNGTKLVINKILRKSWKAWDNNLKTKPYINKYVPYVLKAVVVFLLRSLFLL